jgi:hypothetical protein
MPLWTQSYHRIRFWCRRCGIPKPTKGSDFDTDKFLKILDNLPEWERRWFAVRFPGTQALVYYFTNFGADEQISYPNTYWDPRKEMNPESLNVNDSSKSQTKDDWEKNKGIFSELWKYDANNIPQVTQPLGGDQEAEYLTHKLKGKELGFEGLVDYGKSWILEQYVHQIRGALTFFQPFLFRHIAEVP